MSAIEQLDNKMPNSYLHLYGRSLLGRELIKEGINTLIRAGYYKDKEKLLG